MVATVKTLDINPTPFFVPPRVGGDREFNGHGPRVEVSATLSVRNANELWASVYMHAKETQHDWTEAEGTAEYLVFRDAQVTRINRIMSDVHSFHGYTDTSHATDLLELPAGELARQFECIGDTRGNEAGIRTGVRVHFNPVTVEVETEPGPVQDDSGRAYAEVHSLACGGRPGIRRPRTTRRSFREHLVTEPDRDMGAGKDAGQGNKTQLDRSCGVDQLHDLSPRSSHCATHDADLLFDVLYRCES